MKYLIPFLFILISTLSIGQNIGVGTIEPKAKLHVAGQLRTDSSLVLDTIALPAGDFINVPKEAGFVKVTNQFGHQANQMMMNGFSKVGQILFVYNEDDDSVFFHDKIITPRSTSLFINEGMSWLQITDKNASNMLSDANGDTRVLVEKRPDEDKIRFEIAGDSIYTMEHIRDGFYRLSVKDDHGSVLIGEEVGSRLYDAPMAGWQNTAIGNFALNRATVSTYSTALGSNALGIASKSIENTALGYGSGYSLDGDFNSILGSGAAEHLEGNYNSVIGKSSGRSLEGDLNTVVGYQAAYRADSTNMGIFLGNKAGHSASGDYNIFIGDSSGFDCNYSSYGNIFIGRKSGALNKSGEFNTVLGNLAGVNSKGSENVLIGYNAAKSALPSKSIFIGKDAGSENITSSRSTVLGTYSASSVDTLSNSTIIGFEAGKLGGSMHYNTIIGSQSGTKVHGEKNTILGYGTGGGCFRCGDKPDGDNNVFIGSSAAKYAANDNENTIIGSEAGGNANTIGDGNVFLGFRAGYFSDILEKSILIGYQAGYNSIGENVIFMGDNTGRINAGDNNQFIGNLSGRWNTTGSNNLFLGFRSGHKNSYGSQNLFIGTQSGENNTTASNNTALGYRSLYSNETGTSNLAIGTDALFRNLAGSRNIAIGDSAGFNNRSSVGKNIFIGHGAGKNELGKNKLIIENSSSNDPLIYGDFKADYLSLGGNLYSEMVRPKSDITYSLGQSYYRYTAVYALNGTIQTSDVRQKKNIKDLSYGLNEVMAMRSVSYEWKHDSIGETKVGFIAQELEEIVPEVVVVGDDSLQTRGVNYAELIPVLVKAIQEQQEIITDLEEENDLKTADLDAVNNRLSALEQRLNLLVGDLAKK
ncbi:MAG: tail fiber domain-containing protein [Bacteroidia bacterium]